MPIGVVRKRKKGRRCVAILLKEIDKAIMIDTSFLTVLWLSLEKVRGDGGIREGGRGNAKRPRTATSNWERFSTRRRALKRNLQKNRVHEQELSSRLSGAGIGTGQERNNDRLKQALQIGKGREAEA